MATQTWLGNAAAVAQITTLTPASPSANDTFSITCNSKTLSYVTAAGTVADVCSGISNLISKSAYAEFKEFTATVNSGTVVLTGNTVGLPFAVTLAVTTSGSATFTQSTGTAATGPNDWANTANWSSGSVPVSGDVVYISTGSVPIFYGLGQSAVTLTSLNIAQSYTGTIGLPTYNRSGYWEYRANELAISATTVNVGTGSTGNGSGRIKLNVGSVACTLNVYNTGQPLDQGNPALTWRGTSASSVVNLNKGSIGIAFFPGNTATVSALNIGYVSNQSSDVQLICGVGVTLTTLDMNGGGVQLNNGATTITQNAGTLSVLGMGGVTTLNVDGGTCIYNSTGTLTTATIAENGTLDFSQDQQAKTVTNTIKMYGDSSTLSDPFQVVGSLVVDLQQSKNIANLNLGTNIKLTRGTPP
jgi:hypothetical protein